MFLEDFESMILYEQCENDPLDMDIVREGFFLNFSSNNYHCSESVSAFNEVRVQSTKPSWITNDDINLYKSKAETIIKEYRKNSKNIPVPRQRFKVNNDKTSRCDLVSHQTRSWGWLNPSHAESICIDGATPDTFFIHSELNYTLFFVSSRVKNKTIVYLMDSYIDSYHKKLGEFSSNIKITDIMKNTLNNYKL